MSTRYPGKLALMVALVATISFSPQIHRHSVRNSSLSSHKFSHQSTSKFNGEFRNRADWYVEAQEAPSPQGDKGDNGVNGKGDTNRMGEASTPSEQTLRQNLNKILSGSEYQAETAQKTSIQEQINTLRKLWDRIKEWFKKLFEFGEMSGGNSALVYVVVVLLLLFLLWIILRIWKDTAGRTRRPGISNSPLTASEEALPEMVRDPDYWADLATESETRGDYRHAFRARFIGLLLALDRVDLLSYHRARTTGDYLQELRTHSHSDFARFSASSTLYGKLLRQMEPLTHAFDRIWYGPEGATETEYTDLKQASEQTHETVIALVANTQKELERLHNANGEEIGKND